MSTITITFDADLLDVSVNEITYQLDTSKPIPNESLVKVFRYGLQRIVNDACGGKDKTDAWKAEKAAERIAAIYSGDIASRATSAESEPPLMFFIREVVRQKLGEVSRKEYKAIASDDQAARRAFILAKFEAASEAAKAAITAQAQVNLDESIAKAKRAKAIDVSL